MVEKKFESSWNPNSTSDSRRAHSLVFLFWRLKKVDNEQSETWCVWICTELFSIIFNCWKDVAGVWVRIWGNLAELSLVIWYYSDVKNESKRVNEAPEWTHSLSLSLHSWELSVFRDINLCVFVSLWFSLLSDHVWDHIQTHLRLAGAQSAGIQWGRTADRWASPVEIHLQHL